MKLMHLTPSAVLGVAVALLVSGWGGLACSSRSPVAEAPVADGASPGVAGSSIDVIDVKDIIVVEQSGLASIRARYVVSESAGEITARAACESGTADDACTAAAHQQLREEAKKRGVGLVVITSTALMQTFPPQISVRATLHRITPR